MRSRLLVSVAMLVAGLAMASAQNAPGHERNAVRSKGHPGRSAAVKMAARPPMRAGATGSAQTSSHASALRPRSARGQALPLSKHNDASLQPRRSQGARSGDPSGWEGAMAQGRLRPQDRGSRSNGQANRGQARRRAPDQGMGSSVHKTARRHDTHQSAGVAARQDDIRKAQTALNEQGFNVGDPDGKLGRRTKEALVSFQKQRGFRTTGKVDRTTLQALVAAPGSSQNGSPQNDSPQSSQNASGSPGQNNSPNAASPAPAAPPAVAPPGTTTGQGAPQPPAAASPPSQGQAPASPDDVQTPDNGASRRVPAGSPQEDYKDESAPSGGDDQR